MKKTLLFFILLNTIVAHLFSQNQANNWYFGNNAGLTFNSGNPIPLANGAMQTDEGCSSFSDESGNLLFYTDGSRVWNRNHIVMPNGNGLGGDSSSSQSGLIVPNPGNSDIFYLFTVGANSSTNAGFQYSTIDMSTIGGLGSVIGTAVNLSGTQRNQWSEKVTSVQTNNCDGFWVISLVRNQFHTYLVDNSGVSSTPIISNVGNTANDVRGYLKVSPDGSKLVSANMNSGTYLYDFDNTTGIVSNGNPLNINSEAGYGVEFSLESSKLYISTGAFQDSTENLYQFDLNNATFNDIDNSRVLIHSYFNSRGALQLASDGKIYWASQDTSVGNIETFISVINNPQNPGLACNYSHKTVSLGIGVQRCRQGLPPFIQSLFINDIVITVNDINISNGDVMLCDGDTFRLEPDISSYPVTTTYQWFQTVGGIQSQIPVTTSFLDINDSTVYGAGSYKLEIDFHDGSCIQSGIATVVYHPNPIVNSPILIKQCDDDSDGFSDVNLVLANPSISANVINETFTYHISQTQAEAGINAILTPSNYNTNSTTIWARVENNNGCTTVAQVDIVISATNTAFSATYHECDDYLDINGNDTANNDDRDGISQFDFSSVTNNVLSQFPTAQQPNLSVSYYHNISDGLLQVNEITDISNYRNITSPNYEKIYIRVNSVTDLDCVGFGENLVIELFVEALPFANSINTIIACDDDQDGIFPFDTSSVENDILQGQTNVTVTYFNEDGSQILPTLPDPFNTNSQIITIRVTNNTSSDPDGACYDETTLEFFVDKLPIANPVIIQPLCDDKPDDTDGMSMFDTSQIEATILGGTNAQPNTEVLYFDQNGNALPSPLPNPFNTDTQTITVEVRNTNNTNCTATTQIDFIIIDDKPIFEVSDHLLCTNELPTPLIVQIENAQDTYNYIWEDSFGNQIGTNADSVEIVKGGEYTVTATTMLSICSVSKTFFVQESSLPVIETVTIFDNLPNNEISILVSGIGNYEFALDDSNFITGNTSSGHIFNNVEEGIRTIHILDLNGCGEITKEVLVVRFPKFFTPNGDGINDYWRIFGTEIFENVFVTIFDRQGKIITNFNGSNSGWDGSFLGKLAFPTDYWFYAKFIDFDGKIMERKGHFSLRY
jgi:gliding motility-associated-like protein